MFLVTIPTQALIRKSSLFSLGIILQNILLYLFICVKYKQTTTFLHLSGHNSQGRT